MHVKKVAACWATGVNHETVSIYSQIRVPQHKAQEVYLLFAATWRYILSAWMSTLKCEITTKTNYEYVWQYCVLWELYLLSCDILFILPPKSLSYSNFLGIAIIIIAWFKHPLGANLCVTAWKKRHLYSFFMLRSMPGFGPIAYGVCCQPKKL